MGTAWRVCRYRRFSCRKYKERSRRRKGLQVSVNNLIAVYDTNKSNPENSLAHYYKLVYYCEKISGNLTTSIETSSVAFFDVKNLPELSTKRNTKKQIIECFENRHNKTIIE